MIYFLEKYFHISYIISFPQKSLWTIVNAGLPFYCQFTIKMLYSITRLTDIWKYFSKKYIISFCYKCRWHTIMFEHFWKICTQMPSFYVLKMLGVNLVIIYNILMANWQKNGSPASTIVHKRFWEKGYDIGYIISHILIFEKDIIGILYPIFRKGYGYDIISHFWGYVNALIIL